MSNSKHKTLRDALAAGPTAGPWGSDGVTVISITGAAIADCCLSHGEPFEANTNYIAAANPQEISELLKERDMLLEALDEAASVVSLLPIRFASRINKGALDDLKKKSGKWIYVIAKATGGAA